MKPLVVFHAHCTDGFGAAFAAWMKFGDEAEYLPASYGKFQWPVVTGRNVYILDFSFSKEETEGVMKNANKVVWLDHHKTAFEMWCGKYEKGDQFIDRTEPNYIYLNDNKSGAMLAWEYFHPGTLAPMMIKHIDDRDRWQFKIEWSKEFHAALDSYKPWSFEQWKKFLDDPSDELGLSDIAVIELKNEGSAILRAHEQNVKSVVAAGRRDCLVPFTPVGSHWSIVPQMMLGLACNCPPFLASDAGHELANQSKTFGLCWYQGRDGKAKVSLRSNGDYDVSVIAKSFGGGGHRNAAGFEVEMSTLQGWLK